MGNHCLWDQGDPQQPAYFSTGTSFMYSKYGILTCEYLQKWGDLTKSEISLRWPKWGSFDTSKLFLSAQLEKACSKIELNEWNGYFD